VLKPRTHQRDGIPAPAERRRVGEDVHLAHLDARAAGIAADGAVRRQAFRKAPVRPVITLPRPQWQRRIAQPVAQAPVQGPRRPHGTPGGRCAPSAAVPFPSGRHDPTRRTEHAEAQVRRAAAPDATQAEFIRDLAGQDGERAADDRCTSSPEVARRLERSSVSVKMTGNMMAFIVRCSGP
jgi:hypothetical protein